MKLDKKEKELLASFERGELTVSRRSSSALKQFSADNPASRSETKTIFSRISLSGMIHHV